MNLGNPYDPKVVHRRKVLYSIMHICVLLLSIFLVVSISIDTFHNVAFYRQPRFIRLQFWICAVFLLDFFVEWFLAEKKWHYLFTHFIFFLVSIPYLAIIEYFNLTFSMKVTYLLQYIPLVRGGYAMAIVIGWFTYNRATGLFFTYIFTLLSTVYFASLLFFVFEHDVNSLVVDYQSALWWAAMDVTTVGSNIEAVTPVGRVLSVLLAALGMMMFPIFTVYVTNLIKHRNEEGAEVNGVFYTTRELLKRAMAKTGLVSPPAQASADGKEDAGDADGTPPADNKKTDGSTER